MRRLIQSYDWIPYVIPKRPSTKNTFPLFEMCSRQWTLARKIYEFRPDIVASLFGSYCQTAWIFGVRNIIFTDSEFQHFNHSIAHPFANEIHTPYCFYKPLGQKQKFYKGIHELSFLDGRRFTPDPQILRKFGDFSPGNYIVLRLSAWNTFHDINQSGIGTDAIAFVREFCDKYRIIISAEEDCLPAELKPFAMQFPPEDFHHVLAFSRFVLTEGASTASEAACLGVPTVYINSTEPRGYLLMLEQNYGLVRNFQSAAEGVPNAINWLRSIDDIERERFAQSRQRIINDHCDVCDYVINTIEQSQCEIPHPLA